MKRKYKDRKRRFNFDRLFKGFTLVELLAVIVILAIIMLIAIPAILNSLEIARKRTFIEFATKSYDNAVKTNLNEEIISGVNESCVIYNIKTDLGMNNTGDYKGYVLIVNDNKEAKYYLVLYNDTYMIGPALYNDDNFNIEKLKRYNNAKDEDIKSSLALEGGCINYTNKSDGTTGNSIPEDGISKKLKVGDYVKYYPVKSSYTLDDKLTGCSDTDECGADTINPSSTTLWMVSSINEDGTVTISSKSNKKIHLWGLTGYKYGVYVLKNAARQYSDNKFAKSIKTVGEDSSVEILEDSVLADVKENCTTDLKCVTYMQNNNLGEDDAIKEFGNLTPLNRYFLVDTFVAGRNKESFAWYSHGVMIYHIGNVSGDYYEHSRMDGVYDNNPIYGRTYSCGSGDYNCKFMNGAVEGYQYAYVSVLVNLKANTKVLSGNGTKSNPYELTF